MKFGNNVFESDRIKIGRELREHLPQPYKAKESSNYVRLCIAINTHYPEITGGYYENSRVLAAIEDSTGRSSLFLVNPEYTHCDEGVCPTERLLMIEKDEPHLVFDQLAQPCGRLIKWQYNVGGGGDFFGDDVIIDLLLEPSLVDNVVQQIEAVCMEQGITCG